MLASAPAARELSWELRLSTTHGTNIRRSSGGTPSMAQITNTGSGTDTFS